VWAADVDHVWGCANRLLFGWRNGCGSWTHVHFLFRDESSDRFLRGWLVRNLDVTRDPHTDARDWFYGAFYRRAADGFNLRSVYYSRRDFNCSSQGEGAKSPSISEWNASNGCCHHRNWTTNPISALARRYPHRGEQALAGFDRDGGFGFFITVFQEV